MESRLHQFEGNEVHSVRFGTGPELLIAFHGYADRARLFAPLTEVLQTRYTIIAFDLPFHGQTKWHKNGFTRRDILGIVQMYCKEEGTEAVTLLGYSFGARIVQALLPDLIAQTQHIYLLAPDGIATRGMRAAIYTPLWLRKVFFKLLKHPAWFIKTMGLLKKTGLVSPFITLFIEKNLTTPDRFARTFGMWFALDDFWLRRKEVRKLLNKHPITVDVFFGKKDIFIKYKKVKKLADRVEQVRLHLLDTGHRIIGPELAQRMKEVI